MPKIKTNRGTAKRFRVTAKGKLKHRRAFRNHILTKKSAARKHQLASPSSYVNQCDETSIKRLLVIEGI